MALIALNQYDLKKIIAYSTSSQLGFMMIAIGLGCYPLALFHLVTHACFKSLLFLGAGKVIHHMHGEQDIRNMGGLWRQLPLTYGAFLIGTLSMAGIPFLAGYYSKEAILLYGWAEYGMGMYAIGILLAFLTSTYIFKLFFLVFHGKGQSATEKAKRSLGLQIPLIVLALAAIGAGYLLSPYFYTPVKASLVLHVLPILGALFGIGLIILCYGTKWSPLKYVWPYIEGAHIFLAHKLYLDELYAMVFVEPFKYLSKFLAEKIDLKIMDQGVFGSIPVGLSNLHDWIKGAHTGYLPNYALWVVLGFLCVLICLLRGAL